RRSCPAPVVSCVQCAGPRRSALAVAANGAAELPRRFERPSAGELGQRRALVRRDVIGLVALDLVLGFLLAGTAAVTLVLEVLRVDLRDRAADPARLGVPADVVADVELLAHDAPPQESGEVTVPSCPAEGSAPDRPSSCGIGSASFIRCTTSQPRAASVLAISRRWQRQGIGSPHMITTRLSEARSVRRSRPAAYSGVRVWSA